MYKTLDHCFGDKVKITFKEFQNINEEIASDMLLSVLNLFREKLPCSENFWRYKRNYEMHLKTSQSQRKEGVELSASGSSLTDQQQADFLNPPKKLLASPIMSKVRALSPYMESMQLGDIQNSPLLRYAQAQKDGAGPQKPKIPDSPKLDGMDEQTVTNAIPISKFKSNHLSKKEKQLDLESEIQEFSLSPTSANALRDVNFKHIDH